MAVRVSRSASGYSMRYCFFFNDTAPTEIYTLSLHDALPIRPAVCHGRVPDAAAGALTASMRADRKSTRLNSSHMSISYAVFCLKTKKTNAEGRRWQQPQFNFKRTGDGALLAGAYS